MKKVTKKERKFLKKFIECDDDFKKIFIGHTNEDINSSIDCVIDDIELYVLDKRYADVSWYDNSRHIFDLDGIYLDIKAYINEC